MPFLYSTDTLITDYRSSCTIDNQIMADNGIKTQEEYRAFLQKNGDKLIGNIRKNAEKRLQNNVKQG